MCIPVLSTRLLSVWMMFIGMPVGVRIRDIRDWRPRYSAKPLASFLCSDLMIAGRFDCAATFQLARMSRAKTVRVYSSSGLNDALQSAHAGTVHTFGGNGRSKS